MRALFRMVKQVWARAGMGSMWGLTADEPRPFRAGSRILLAALILTAVVAGGKWWAQSRNPPQGVVVEGSPRSDPWLTGGRGRRAVGAAEDDPPASSVSMSSPQSRAQLLNAFLNGSREDPQKYSDRVLALLQDWAEADPEAALGYALTPLGDDNVNALFLEAVPDVMALWAGWDPEAARAYVSARGSIPAMVRTLAPAMMRVYSHYKPDEALAWVRTEITSDSDELRPQLAAALVRTFYEDGRAMELWGWLAATDVHGSAYAQPAMKEFAARLAAADPREALHFADSLPAGSMARGLVLQETLRRWAADDSRASYEWLVGVVRDMEAVASSSSSPFMEIPQALVIPGTYSEAELDYAIAGYALGMAAEDPKGAGANAGAIHDPSLRSRVGALLGSAAP